MNVIVAGLNETSTKIIKSAVCDLFACENVTAFSDPMLLIKYSINNPIDIVFTEIKLRHIDGFTLIDMLRKKNPKIKFVVVTDSNQIANVLKQKEETYLLEPLKGESVKTAVTRLCS